ncbi:MAG: polyprenyl synthetase family protein [Fimbriimonadaceae bacterium]
MIAPTYLTEKVGPEVFQEIAAEILRVEQVLTEAMESQVGLVSEVGLHTLAAGGKRLRPALVVLAARACGLPFDADRARKIGAAMEMIHMATLIHDDVIDHAATRRGRPTASAEFGNTASILTGDVLLSKAMAVLCRDGDIRIIRTVSEAVVELAEGEVAELATRGNFDLTEEEHFRILRLKTASFIEACCQVGAMIAGADEAVITALGTYGHHLGIAFQLVDDLLDYSGDQKKTGKPRATDFSEGCATLPLILFNQLAMESDRQWISERFGQVSADVISDIVRKLSDVGALAAAKRRTEDVGRSAISALADLPESVESELLRGVVRFVLDREG